MSTQTLPNYQLIKEAFVELLVEDKEFKFSSKSNQLTQAEKYLDQVFESKGSYVLPDEKTQLLYQLMNEVVWGLHGLQEYNDDPEVEEIMVNGYETVFIKKRFEEGFELTSLKFTPEELSHIIERLLDGTGRRVDRSSPVVDVRLKNGSRVNIVVSPISAQGPIITVRKFPEKVYTPEQLIQFGMIPKELSEFLQLAVKHKANILISGGTSTGKTTLTSAMLQWVKGGVDGDRIVLIEETSEIKTSPVLLNIVRLETRLANVEGEGELTIRDLVKNALRMRPDRIIVGESRGGEAYDLLQAMNTGHPGSMTTLHANSPETALDRLESLVLLAGFQELPLAVIRTWIARSIDLIIQLKRDDKQKRIISEVCSIDKHGQLTKLTTKNFNTFITHLKTKNS